jgi:hypothetical protein
MTALLSPVVAGRMRTWTAGGGVLWQVHDAAHLSQALGMGVVGRTQMAPGRFREVGLLDDSGTVLIPERSADGDGGVRGRAHLLTRTEARPSDWAAAWREFAEWLAAAAVSAARRGDLLILERGGWDYRALPYVLLSHVRHEGSWFFHLEASPAPSRSGIPWPPPQGRPMSGYRVPAHADTVGLATILIEALLEWADSPLDLAITYAPSPDGPLDLSTLAE